MPLSSVSRDAIAMAMLPKTQQPWQLLDHEAYLDEPAMGYLGDVKKEAWMGPSSGVR
jgi:hypothetical protein